MNRVTKLLGTAVLAVSMMVSFTGCQGLYDRIEYLETQVKTLQAELDSVTATQAELDELQKELDAIKASDSADSATIESIESQIKAISEALDKINKDLASETEDVDAEDYADEISELEARIESLEKQLEDAKNKSVTYTVTFQFSNYLANKESIKTKYPNGILGYAIVSVNATNDEIIKKYKDYVIGTYADADCNTIYEIAASVDDLPNNETIGYTYFEVKITPSTDDPNIWIITKGSELSLN